VKIYNLLSSFSFSVSTKIVPFIDLVVENKVLTTVTDIVLPFTLARNE
jgi:hypothetical protein